MIFKRGSLIEFEGGAVATVVDEIGSGGQGAVYKVKIGTDFYAVKMYHANFANGAKRFKKNLIANIRKGPVSSKFIWPLKLSKTYEDGSFGYLMNLIPEDYLSFTSLMTSVKMGREPEGYYFRGAIIAACHIAFEFRKFWKSGKCFQDLNEGSIFINPKNWDVLICDCDNANGEGTDIFVQGMPRYMAPEIVSGKSKPNYRSDVHSASVLIYMLLFGGMHPFEGKESRRLTIENPQTSSLEIYGDSAIYVMDPSNDKNRPQKGIDDLFMSIFPFYPSYIKDFFENMFVLGTKVPNKRPGYNEILAVLGRVLNNITMCPYCGRPLIPDLDKNGLEEICLWPGCKKDYKVPLYLENKYIRLFVMDKQRIYKWHLRGSAPEENDSFDVVGEIIRDNDGSYKIRNVSNFDWILTFRGDTRPVPNGKTVKIKYNEAYKLTINKIDFIVR